MSTQEIQILQIIASLQKTKSYKRIADIQIAKQSALELEEIRIHLDLMEQAGYVTLRKEFGGGHSAWITPEGKMLLRESKYSQAAPPQVNIAVAGNQNLIGTPNRTSEKPHSKDINAERNFVMALAIVLWLLVEIFSSKTSIEKIKLDNGQIVKIWYETDINHIYPAIYYEITQATKVVVPATIIMVDYDNPHCHFNPFRSKSFSYRYECRSKPYKYGAEYETEIAFAQDKTLVCIYAPMHWDDGFLILYDIQTGESWPAMLSPELWRNRYAQLRDENPGLPAGGLFARYR